MLLHNHLEIKGDHHGERLWIRNLRLSSSFFAHVDKFNYLTVIVNFISIFCDLLRRTIKFNMLSIIEHYNLKVKHYTCSHSVGVHVCSFPTKARVSSVIDS